MTLTDWIGVGYVSVGFIHWRFASYIMIKNAAKGETPDGDDLFTGMGGALVLSLIWPASLCVKWFKRPPLLLRAHEDRRKLKA